MSVVSVTGELMILVWRPAPAGGNGRVVTTGWSSVTVVTRGETRVVTLGLEPNNISRVLVTRVVSVLMTGLLDTVTTWR